MKKIFTQVCIFTLALFLLLSMHAQNVHAEVPPDVAPLIGNRYECLYAVENGEKRFIHNAEERPFVEFTTGNDCRYELNDEADYTVVNDRVLVTEYGIFPIYTFTISGEHLHVAGLGLMGGSSDTEYDEWFYKVGSADYQKICSENATADNQRLLSSIRRVDSIYSEHCGYVCIEDSDRKFYFIDESGTVVREQENPYYSFSSGSTTHLAPGTNSYFHYDNHAYTLYDIQGNALRTFEEATSYEEGYTFLSSVHEGLITAQEATNTQNTGKTAIVYFDETGNEVFRFNGYVHAGAASGFSGGRAFICQLYKDNSKDYPYTGNYPTNWTIIDKNGTASPLVYANLSLLAGSLKNQMETILASGLYDDVYVEIKGYEIVSVIPFHEDEEYAACLVEVHADTYMRDSDSWSKDYRKGTDTFYVPSRINKSGKVYFSQSVFDYKRELSAYTNGCVIVYANNEPFLLVDFEKGKSLLLEEHSVVIAEKAKGDGYGTWIRLDFMDDGTFRLISYGHGSKRTAAIITSDGTVVEGPKQMNEYPYYSGSTRDEYFLQEFDLLSKYYDWQKQNLYQYSVVLSRDGLYPQRSDRSPYLWGYADIWNNFVIEPQYYRASLFDNGYAFVSIEEDSAKSDMKKYAKNTIMIDKNGNQVDKVVFADGKTVDTSALESRYSAQETLMAASTILETDAAFVSVTNMSVLPAGLGETLGYLYDVATFDLPGLIKHIYSDATYQYREEAARLIAHSMLGDYDEMELTAVSMLIQEYLKSDEYKLAKEYKKKSSEMMKDMIDLLEKLENGDNVTWFIQLGKENMTAFGRYLSCMSLFGEYIDQIEVSMDDRLVLYLLASNYEKNMAYIKRCIATCDPSNTEMLEIYRIVQRDLHSMYEAYLQNASAYIAAEGVFNVFFSEVTYDFVTDTISGAGLTVTQGLKTANNAMLMAKGVSKANAEKITNAYLLAHSLVVKYAEDVGTKDTYQTMQKLYENALVLNAMTQELRPLVQKATVSPKGYEKELIPKAIALGEYRLMVLDNVKAYRDACSSAEFLDPDLIASERLQIQAALEYLYERQAMLD